jgi:hypothetical protein
MQPVALKSQRVLSQTYLNHLDCGEAGPGVAQWLRRCATSRKVPGRVTGDFFSEAYDKSMCPGSK